MMLDQEMQERRRDRHFNQVISKRSNRVWAQEKEDKRWRKIGGLRGRELPMQSNQLTMIE
jgi:hypothetical protein